MEKLITNIPHQDITYAIIGAAMRVHSRMIRGLKEIHYQRALTQEMRQVELIVEEEYQIEIYDNQIRLGRLYLDHWVNECVVVEDKAFSHPLGDREIAQTIAYLAATKAKVGLLLNFGRKRLEYKRILPPKSLGNWQQEIQPYLWTPYQTRQKLKQEQDLQYNSQSSIEVPNHLNHL